MTPPLFFLIKIALITQGLLLKLHMNFRTFFSPISGKNTIKILIWIALNLQITFGSMDILIILILLICEHRLSMFLLGIFYYLLSLLIVSMFRFSIPSYFSLGRLYVLRDLLISSRLSNLLTYNLFVRFSYKYIFVILAINTLPFLILFIWGPLLFFS